MVFKLSVLFLAVVASQINHNSCQFHGESLKFKLAAINLPNVDVSLEGVSDPYAILFASTEHDDDRKLRHWQKFGQTSAIKDTLDPVWDEVLVYQYIEGANQTWRIFVNDRDDSFFNPLDDPLGRVDVRVEDYLRKIKNSRDNETTSNSVQLFLSHPTGGVLIVTPISD